MSSESVSSGTAQKEISIDLVDGELLIRGSVDVAVDIARPKLNIGKLYESLFADIEEPTSMEVKYSDALKGDRKAVEIADSIKTIIDDASEKINAELTLFLNSHEEEGEESDLSGEDLPF